MRQNQYFPAHFDLERTTHHWEPNRGHSAKFSRASFAVKIFHLCCLRRSALRGNSRFFLPLSSFWDCLVFVVQVLEQSMGNECPPRWTSIINRCCFDVGEKVEWDELSGPLDARPNLYEALGGSWTTFVTYFFESYVFAQKFKFLLVHSILDCENWRNKCFFF